MSRELFKRSLPGKQVSWNKNRRVARNWRKILRVGSQMLLAAVVLAAAAWAWPRAAGEVSRLFLQQDSLTLRKLILEGNRLVSREDVLAALGLVAGENLVAMDIREMARKLERLPAVKSALIKKQFPSTLYVRIVERRPLFILGGEQGVLVDDEGLVMGAAGTAGEALPVVNGLDPGTRGSISPEAVAVVGELKAAAVATGLGWPGMFTLLDLSGEDGPVVFLEGIVPVRLGRGGYREKLQNLANVLPRVTGGSMAVSSIDLRFDRRVVVSTQTSPEEQSSSGEGQVSERG